MNGPSTILTQIPTSFYVIVGGLLLANLSAVVTVFYGVGKVIWWASKVDSKLDEHGKDIHSAFIKIRELKNDNINNGV